MYAYNYLTKWSDWDATNWRYFFKSVRHQFYYFPGGSDCKASACKVEGLGSIPDQEDSLEKEMATHSSIFAWKIPWVEEPSGLQSTGLQRVGHDWATNIHTQGISHFITLMSDDQYGRNLGRNRPRPNPSAKWVTVLDLKHVFFCISLAKESQYRFAFEWEAPGERH